MQNLEVLAPAGDEERSVQLSTTVLMRSISAESSLVCVPPPETLILNSL